MKPSSLTPIFFSGLVLAMFMGCSDNVATPSQPGTDFDVQTDTSYGDTTLPDIGYEDIGPSDTGQPDTHQPDVSSPDSSQPDADLPDADLPDADLPDADLPDTDLPDADLPDADLPDTDLPDTDAPIEGSVAFTEPVAATVYTNDSVDFVIEVIGDAEDIRLVTSDDTLIATLDATLSTTWSTVALDEGPYEVQIHYSVDGVDSVHDEVRTVIVDRTAPVIVSSTPEAGASDVDPATPITVTFNEPLDPASLTTDTVMVFIGPDLIASTFTLSADGLVLTLEFAPALAVQPYGASVVLDGITDLAGNETLTKFDWYVPSWIEETVNGALNLSMYTILEVNGVEYLIARQRPTASVMVFKATAGEWSEVASESFDSVTAVAATTKGDKIFIAISNLIIDGQTQDRSLRLLEFDTAHDTLIVKDGEPIFAKGAGDTALDLSVQDNDGIIVAAFGGDLYAFEFNGEDLIMIKSTIALDAYPDTRVENVKTQIDSDLKREIIFAQCTQRVDGVCRATSLRHLTRTALEDTWTQETGIFNVLPNVGDTCDKFIGFDGYLVDGGAPLGLMSYRTLCTEGIPAAQARTGSGFSLPNSGQLNLADRLPGQDLDSIYTPFVAAGSAPSSYNSYYVLYAATNRLELARYQDWVSTVDTGLTPGLTPGTQYVEPGLFYTSQGLLVVFSFGTSTHIFRVND